MGRDRKVMNSYTLASCFLVLTLHQATAELEAEWSGKLLDREYINKDLGLHLTIQKTPIEQLSSGQWGRGSGGVSVKNGTKVATWIRESDEGTISCTVPLDEVTIWRLIRESAEPPEFRFVAITNLHLLDLPNEKKAKMLEESTRIEDAWVRGHAWSRVFWFPERSKVAHLFPQAIKDPCLSIAHDALPEICKYYGLRNFDGTEIKITLMWRGLATEMYRVFHQEVEIVAERLRDHDSGLMSLEDLEKIRHGRVPPDEWFRRTLGREPPEDVSYYLEPYKKTPNK